MARNPAAVRHTDAEVSLGKEACNGQRYVSNGDTIAIRSIGQVRVRYTRRRPGDSNSAPSLVGSGLLSSAARWQTNEHACREESNAVLRAIDTRRVYCP